MIARCLLQLAAVASLAAVEVRQPNVIIVLADDQGYGDMSCHGNPVLRTPQMDRLHAESVRLTDFHVAPMCSPTRGQLMTGVDALRNGAYSTCQGRSSLRTNLPTLPQMLAAGGYRTGIFGKWHLGHGWPDRPQDRGFQTAVSFNGFGFTDIAARWGGDYLDPWILRDGIYEQQRGYCTDLWFSEAMRWIGAQAEAGQPFFAYIPTNAPHFPYWPPADHAQDYAGSKAPEFFAMLANLDDNLGRLRSFLGERHLDRDTILVYFSDNGGTGGVSTWNAGMKGGKCSRYEGGHRVPCFVSWPAGQLRTGSDLAEPTQVQDLVPTLLDLCRIPAAGRPRFDGISLAAALRDGEKLPERSFVVQIQQGRLTKGECAVVSGAWRLVDGRQLFDIHADPGQEHDLAAGRPEVLKRLSDHYESWWAEVAPLAAEVLPTRIGEGPEPVMRLYASQWLDLRADGQATVREAKTDTKRGLSAEGGVWKLRVATAGRYRISVSRWPEGVGLALDEGVPEFRSRCGGKPEPAGVALPITRIRLRAGAQEHLAAVTAGAQRAEFEIDLPAGDLDLSGTCLDAAGQALCGAYSASIGSVR